MFRSLKEDITESQTDIRIQKSDLFEIPLSLNTLQIDNKLIIYNKMEKETDFFLLKDCKRGAFMTKASDHSSKTPLYKLSDHVYKVFFRDLALQDTLADRIADLMNRIGLSQISLIDWRDVPIPGMTNTLFPALRPVVILSLIIINK